MRIHLYDTALSASVFQKTIKYSTAAQHVGSQNILGFRPSRETPARGNGAQSGTYLLVVIQNLLHIYGKTLLYINPAWFSFDP